VIDPFRLAPHALCLIFVSEQEISRVLFPEGVALFRGDDHSSKLDVAVELERPTRELGRTTLQRPPIWSCSRRGLPSPRRHRRGWWALTSPFHPYPLRHKMPDRAVSFLLHFPSRRRDWALPSALSSGARTFLPPARRQGSGHLSCSDTFFKCL